MSKKILIIDDDENHRAIYKTSIEAFLEQDVDVLEASNTEDGLRIIEEQSPDAIVLDNQLPNGTGFRLLYDLDVKMPGHPPVIFLSAAMTSELSRNAKALGAVACIQKTDLQPEELARLIEQMTD